MNTLWTLIRRRSVWLSLLLLLWLFCSGGAQAGPLAQRLAQFPDWTGKPPVQSASGDLIYPQWMGGTWQLQTTLVDLAAPLAPEVTTPGFEGNRELLGRPVTCEVRFVPQSGPALGRLLPLVSRDRNIISDRAFNGLSLARAYLGYQAVRAVKVDPTNPNRQVTLLRGDRQLESTVTKRATEAPDGNTFITSEVFQQVFRGIPQPYLNEVESTTAYRRLPDAASFVADQVTAIYLSPRDPDYFRAFDRPVALYRYRLEFTPVEGTDA